MSTPAFLAEMVQVDAYAEIDEILRSRHFEQGIHDSESSDFTEDILINIDGRRHLARRRLEGPLFHRAALATYERQDLMPVVQQTLGRLLASRPDHTTVTVDLVALMDRLLHRIAASTTGLDGVESDEEIGRFVSYIHVMGAGHQVEWWSGDHDDVLSEAVRIREKFRAEFYEPSMRRRREMVTRWRHGDIEDSELLTDLLTALLRQEEPDWDEDLPLREATFYVIAATQTTAHAIPHLFNHLEGWFGAHPEQAHRRHDQEFLRRAAYESLRLHTPHPAFVRVATRDTTLSSGRRFSAGDRVALRYGLGNRDPALFGANSDRFDPDRTVASHVSPWGHTFGAGAHACIGRPLATGTPSRADGTTGTIVMIVSALYRAGAEMVPGDPPVASSTSQHEAFERFPIRFTLGGGRAAT